MSLVEYAREEVRRAGLLDVDSDYDGMLGTAVMELVEKFAEQGHSGYSAAATLSIFARVAAFKPLTPIGSDPDEWMEVSSSEPVWQNRRRSSTFSRDGGKTWYDIDDPKQSNGDHWIRNPLQRWRRRLSR